MKFKELLQRQQISEVDSSNIRKEVAKIITAKLHNIGIKINVAESDVPDEEYVSSLDTINIDPKKISELSLLFKKITLDIEMGYSYNNNNLHVQFQLIYNFEPIDKKQGISSYHIAYRLINGKWSEATRGSNW